MQVTETQVRKLTITGVPGLDSIHVTLEDIAAGKGTLTVRHAGDSWARTWGAMGESTNVAEFVKTTSLDYLIDGVGHSPDQWEDDLDALRLKCKQAICKARRESDFSRNNQGVFRNDWEELEAKIPDDIIRDVRYRREGTVFEKYLGGGLGVRHTL